MDDEAARKVKSARAHLVLDAPFIGALALSLRAEPDESLPDTSPAAVDGEVFRYSPKTIGRMRTHEVAGLWAMAAVHCALGHPWRRQGRKATVWQQACAAISSNVVRQAKLDLPREVNSAKLARGLECDPQKTSTERLYDGLEKLLQQSQSSPGPGTGPGQGSNKGDKNQQDNQQQPAPMGCVPAESKKKNRASELKAKWRQNTQNAILTQGGKRTGTVSQNLARMFKAVLNPPIPWQVILRDFLTETARTNYDWLRPHQRYGEDIIAPSLHDRTLGQVCLAIDTSGSMSRKQVSVAREIAHAISETFHATLTVIACDATVRNAFELAAGEEITADGKQLKGGGGTDFRPVFRWIAKHKPNCRCCIYITDLHGPIGKNNPADCRVLWAVVGRKAEPPQVPFGQVLMVPD